MTPKQKKELFGIINGFLGLIAFYIWYKLSLGIYGLLAILLIPMTISGIIIRIIPDKKTKKKKASNKKQQNSQKTINSKTPAKGHNLLRSENEILTLPLEELTWREFERLCYMYYKGKGYKVEETSEGADGGVDLIVYNRHHKAKVAVQIKHRKTGNQVTVKEIRELNSAKRNHNCELADFITTSRYSSDALKEADKFKIETREIGWVKNNILKWRDQEAKKRNLA